MPWLFSVVPPPLSGPPPVAEAVGGRPEAAVELESVTVLARRGAAPQPPEQEFGGADIDALGARDIGEVIGRLAQGLGGREAPVVIVNGRRVADPQVFFGFPPDALERVEILPPSASAGAGEADPRRRVVNIVLQRRFEGRDLSAAGGWAGAGGFSTGRIEAKRSSIVDDATGRVGLSLNRNTSLRAGERAAYLAEHPGSEALSLRPRSRRAALDVSATRPLGAWRGSLSGVLQGQDSRFVSPDGAAGVQSRNALRSLSLTGGLGGEAGGWSLRSSLAAQASRTDAEGVSRVRSDNTAANLNLSANRELWTLPAGPVTADLSARISRSRSRSVVEASRARFSGRGESLGGQISIPLLRSGDEEEGAAKARAVPGDLTASFGAAARSTDAGRGESLDAGFYWTPVRALSLNGAWSRSTDAATDEQRFMPAVYGSPMVVYDFRDGRSVQVLPLTGGNPDLRPARRSAVTLGLSAGPVTTWRLTGALSYRRAETRDEISALTELTPELEAAFPERYGRDAEGRLLSVDLRPINITSGVSDVLTSDLNLVIPIGGVAGPAGGRLHLSANQLWRLRDRTLIQPGLPRMDRLAGDGGGLVPYELNLRLDARLGTFGVNAGAGWKAGYRVRRDSGRDGAGDLVVGGFGTLGVSLTRDLDRAPAASQAGASRRRDGGTAIGLQIDNLLDARPRARLGDGTAAPGYGRDDRDPVGRLVRIVVSSRF